MNLDHVRRVDFGFLPHSANNTLSLTVGFTLPRSFQLISSTCFMELLLQTIILNNYNTGFLLMLHRPLFLIIFLG